MSTAEKTSLDIFKSIMDWGPLSLYSANAKTRMPIGTIHRHIKLLENAGKIKAYQSKTTGRKKIQYGPTIYGMISFYRQDSKFASQIQNYFLLWIEQKKIKKEPGDAILGFYNVVQELSLFGDDEAYRQEALDDWGGGSPLREGQGEGE